MSVTDPNLVDSEPNAVDEMMPEVGAVQDPETGLDPDSELETNPQIGLNETPDSPLSGGFTVDDANETSLDPARDRVGGN